ncbi:MAG TPA: hypothetical protein VLA78_00950, partial [Paracoccaceae bacterium]|nr:hypothetical protein [Paracoccaceae bacterium]
AMSSGQIPVHPARLAAAAGVRSFRGKGQGRMVLHEAQGRVDRGHGAGKRGAGEHDDTGTRDKGATTCQKGDACSGLRRIRRHRCRCSADMKPGRDRDEPDMKAVA